MQSKFFLLFSIFTSLSLLSCGGGSSSPAPTSLSISASGSATVLAKDSTLAFTANEAAVTWSVVGGDVNGTISASGVYTPPAVLPENTRVTIQAQEGSETATASINLYAGSTLHFATTPTKLNTTSYSNTAISSVLLYSMNDNQIAVGGSDLHLLPTWTDYAGSSDVSLRIRQQRHMADFSSEENLSAGLTVKQTAGAVELDANLNPVVLSLDLTPSVSLGLGFQKSSNGGETFTHVSTFPVTPLSYHASPNFHIDANNVYHVTYTETASPPTGKLYYSQSSDAGLTWSTPLEIGTPGSRRLKAQVLAQDSKINICYTEIEEGPPVKSHAYFISSSNGGASFSSPVRVNELDLAIQCRMAISPSGDIYVAYSDTNNLYVAKSVDAGLTFTQRTKVSDAVYNNPFAFFGFTIDALGRITVGWTADLNSDSSIESILFSRSVDGGLTFSANSEIYPSASREHSFITGMVNDAAGRIYLLYLDGGITVSGSYDIYYSKAE